MSEILTTAEVADRLRLDERTVRRAMVDTRRAGIAPAWIKSGRMVEWDERDLDRWLRDMTRFFDDRRPKPTPPIPPKEIPSRVAHLSSVLREVPVSRTPIGVYLLILSGEIVYVGQSINPAARIAQHAKNRRRPFDRALFFPVPRGELNAVEGAFIRRLRPRYNKNGGALYRADAAVFKRYPLPDLEDR